ncbi:MAG: hypothetical protein DMG61_23695 [Acidobacteria bacterium]|nr:MAG: hypothetical protein DMG61_23695 [Acidobacteriota bacterium]PYY13668.1 MAG: hypothetical protein DMG60_21460 [Acidobacteriota bacterium]
MWKSDAKTKTGKVGPPVGTQNVGHDYVRDEARQLAQGLGISYCEALQKIYEAARAAGNSKKANDTKATQKQGGCRGH